MLWLRRGGRACVGGRARMSGGIGLKPRPPKFVGEATSPMNICGLNSSVMWPHRQIYGVSQSQPRLPLYSLVPIPNR
jgi:hypothetical protein